MKNNQFYRETRLNCPLYIQTEDICIGIYVFKRVCNVLHNMLKKVCKCNIFNNLWGNKEGKYLGISKAEPLRFDCVGHSTV